jgi:hypothetical protein
MTSVVSEHHRGVLARVGNDLAQRSGEIADTRSMWGASRLLAPNARGGNYVRYGIVQGADGLQGPRTLDTPFAVADARVWRAGRTCPTAKTSARKGGSGAGRDSFDASF